MNMKKITILLLVSLSIVIFTACQPAYSYTPNYSTTSFSPNSPVHWHCSYEDGSYYYYNYSDGGFYQIEQETSTFLYDYPSVEQINVINGNIYFRGNLSSIFSIDILTKEENMSMNMGYLDFLYDRKEEAIFTIKRNNAIDMLSAMDITTSPINMFTLLLPQLSAEEENEYSIVSDDIYDYAIWKEADYTRHIIKGIRNKETGEIVFRVVESMYDDSLVYMTSEEMILITRNLGASDLLTKYSKENGIETLLVLPDEYYFYPNNVIQEDDKLIALVQKNNAINVIGNYNMGDKYHYADALISVDIESGDCEYLYETIGDNDRIVGYAENFVYLFKKGRKPNIFSSKSLDAIYRVNLSTGEEVLIHAIEKESISYRFELCGEKIFVWGDAGSLIGAYDLY